MTPADPAAGEQVHDFLTRVDWRLRARTAVHRARWGAALGLAIVLASIAGLLIPDPDGGLWPSLTALSFAALALPLLGGGLSWRRSDLAQAAVVADREADLDDVLKTALELESTSSPEIYSDWTPVVLRQAASSIAELDPKSIVPFPRGSFATTLIVSLAAVLAVVLVSTSERAVESSDQSAPAPEHRGGSQGLRSNSDDAQPRAQILRSSGGPSRDPTLAQEGSGIRPFDRTVLSDRKSRVQDRDSARIDRRAPAGAEIVTGEELATRIDATRIDAGRVDTAQIHGSDAMSSQSGSATPQAGSESLLRELGRSTADPTLPAHASTPSPEAGRSDPNPPRVLHETDQVVAIQAPTTTKERPRRFRRASARQTGMELDGLRVEGAAEADGSGPSADGQAGAFGQSSGQQGDFADPFGTDPTELDVDLELALLRSGLLPQSALPTLEMRPSRREQPTLPSNRHTAPGAAGAEQAVPRAPLPWRYRTLTRAYFAPLEASRIEADRLEDNRAEKDPP